MKDRATIIGPSLGWILTILVSEHQVYHSEVLLIWWRLLLVEIDLGQVLPDPESTVDLFFSLRFGREESEQGTISIGRYIKFPFQRVLICLIPSSDEETTAVSISEVLSVRRRTSCATRSTGGGFLKYPAQISDLNPDYPV